MALKSIFYDTTLFYLYSQEDRNLQSPDNPTCTHPKAIQVHYSVHWTCTSPSVCAPLSQSQHGAPPCTQLLKTSPEACLTSTSTHPGPCFIHMHPLSFSPTYAPSLQLLHRARLKKNTSWVPIFHFWLQWCCKAPAFPCPENTFPSLHLCLLHKGHTPEFNDTALQDSYPWQFA